MCDFIAKILELTTAEKWEEYIQNCTPNSLPYISICRDFNMKLTTNIFVIVSYQGKVVIEGNIELHCSSDKIIGINNIKGEYEKHTKIKDCLRALISLWIQDGGFDIHKSKYFKYISEGNSKYELLTYKELNFDVETKKSKEILHKRKSNDKILVKYNNFGDIMQINIVSNDDISKYLKDNLCDLVCEYSTNTHDNFDVDVGKNKKKLYKNGTANDTITIKYNYQGYAIQIKIVSDTNFQEYVSEYLWNLL